MGDSIKRSEIYYGDDLIPYEVVRKSAKDNSLANKASSKLAKPLSPKVRIKVHPDGRVVVTVPEDATDSTIHDAVQKRARWIWQGLQDFAKQSDDVLPKGYISGETQFYLGRRYVLKVITDPTQVATVKLACGKLNVFLNQEFYDNKAGEQEYMDKQRQEKLSADQTARSAKVKALIEDWYQSRAQVVFAERIKAMLPKASWVTGEPDFKVMAMQKQWGSCSAKGNLMLNLHLIKAPKDCIDYVILHELCHIKIHNHSDQFWRLLTQVMPEWQVVKAKLDGMAEQYLNE